jgi:hypothetical protein
MLLILVVFFATSLVSWMFGFLSWKILLFSVWMLVSLLSWMFVRGAALLEQQRFKMQGEV